MRRVFTSYVALFLLLSISMHMWAQEPAGYYDSAKGKNKKALLTALHNIISDHKNVGYDGLWSVYEKSDVREDGTVWDMYSTATYYPGKKQCGNYKNVGDCYNREHSFPKSWFSGKSPMVSDAFHIYPTDGKVNGQRSNYPYGETANGTTLPSNGSAKALGKLGSCTFPGYSGTVFEPVDEYKGDFARTYFYMATCYQDKIKGWSSPMLSNDDYPCFKSWSISLLLKWCREDPVSKKETDRNNAVYGFQRNRNPYIDHPELVEYIWGNSQESSWTPGGAVAPSLYSPVNGGTVDLGVTSVSLPVSIQVTVKGQALSEDLKITVNGSGFSVSAATVKKEDANAGTNVTVTYQSAQVATGNGSLTVSNKEVSSTITLKALVVDGIPALNATDITLNSFTARWTNVDKTGNYTLNVYESDAESILDGYPVTVAASAEKYNVTGLTPRTDYFYRLSAGNRVSNIIKVTTAATVPVLGLIYPEGGVILDAVPGTPSEVMEIEAVTEYVTEDITATVDAPFQISLNKSDWGQTLTLDPEGERFYIRIAASNEGTYTGTLSVSTPSVNGDEIDVKAFVALPRAFFEDFESITEGGYYSQEIQGTATKWIVGDVGFWGGSDKHNGNLAARFGKTATSFMYMNEDKPKGASTLSFYAALFGSDENAGLDILYSVDGGENWTKVTSMEITNTVLAQYTYAINIAQPIRIKFQQTEGKRLNIDDIAMSDYVNTGIHNTEKSAWDAYSHNGKLILEMGTPQLVKVYAADAATMYMDTPKAGNTSLSLPSGLYIIVCGDQSKKVIVK